MCINVLLHRKWCHCAIWDESLDLRRVLASCSSRACYVFKKPKFKNTPNHRPERFLALHIKRHKLQTLNFPSLSRRREQRPLQLVSASRWLSQPTGRLRPDRGWAPLKVSECPPWSQACVLLSSLQGDRSPYGCRCWMTHRKSSRYRWVMFQVSFRDFLDECFLNENVVSSHLRKPFPFSSLSTHQ